MVAVLDGDLDPVAVGGDRAADIVPEQLGDGQAVLGVLDGFRIEQAALAEMADRVDLARCCSSGLAGCGAADARSAASGVGAVDWTARPGRDVLRRRRRRASRRPSAPCSGATGARPVSLRPGEDRRELRRGLRVRLAGARRIGPPRVVSAAGRRCEWRKFDPAWDGVHGVTRRGRGWSRSSAVLGLLTSWRLEVVRPAAPCRAIRSRHARFRGRGS